MPSSGIKDVLLVLDIVIRLGKFAMGSLSVDPLT
jgi:hypothetical protein